eukprot:gnl/MRDRNA2_/MRDRNA2_31463_c0_seq1.p1 gnl/MRDRNA2_/MRDRNA2_31463_c0~~gnl/MRDRNA2_/MRDRNA2_31463_c0_seq1.p1  ORF type:complete len:582 (+),score=130.65 gnl/MRDRNA2_/MRDRNA2_31463_c0_seq1:84-1748(+)
MAEEGDPGFDPHRRGSKAGTGEDEGNAQLMDDAKLRKIFNQFDADKSGSIDVGELQDAMRMLGVKCSANSAKKVLDVIDTDKNGTVEWEEFHAFFVKVRSQEEIKQLLSACNQKFLDYKMMVEGDPNFGKRFYVPPMLSERQKFAYHNDNVEAVCWLNDEQFASCAIDGDIMIWNANDEGKKVKPVQTFSCAGGKGIYCMNATNDGKFLVTGSGANESNVAWWDISQEKIVQTYQGHTSACFSISLGMDQNRFATGGQRGQVITYDRNNPSPLCQIEDAHTNTVYGVHYRDDCNTVCSCSGDGTIKIWDLQAVRSAKAMAKIDDAAATGVVYDCRWRGEHEIISCGDDFCIKRWDIRKLGEGSITNYFGHTSTVKSICLSEDKKFLVSATHDGSIRLWLADEVGVINDAQVEANNKIEAKERELEKATEKMNSGEEDPERVIGLQAQLKSIKDELTYVNAIRKERDMMSCVQARVCLEGHTLPVIALAWRDRPDSCEATVLSASQDQTIRLFDIDKESLEQFELWSKEEDEPEGRRPSKEGYRRPSKTSMQTGP